MKKLEPIERRIEILKLLQGREMRTGEIAEYFDVDERTIRSDIQALRDGMDILGVKIRIESKHEGTQKHYYKSTVHPIMLALNLSELYALLKLLENAMLQSRGEVYKHIFEQVYSQITDYAEGLIADKLKNKYAKTEISNLLEEEAFRHKDIKLVYWAMPGLEKPTLPLALESRRVWKDTRCFLLLYRCWSISLKNPALLRS
jgi:predicted DNA-binding transcriptional regulator YafY